MAVMFVVLAFLMGCVMPLKRKSRWWHTMSHRCFFSLDILGLLVFVHRVISKTYHTCPIIVIQLLFCVSLFGLVTCSEDYFFFINFFPAIIIFSILGHLPLSFPVISLLSAYLPSCVSLCSFPVCPTLHYSRFLI